MIHRMLCGAQRVQACYRLGGTRASNEQTGRKAKFQVLHSRSIVGRQNGESYVWENAYRAALGKRNVEYGTMKSCAGVTGKVIFWFPSTLFNRDQFDDHSLATYNFARQLERQGNLIFPRSEDLRYWENKEVMHRMFEAQGIKTPKTVIAKDASLVDFDSIEVPILYKGIHACSSALVKRFDERGKLLEFLRMKHSSCREDDAILLQELVNASRDMRIVIVGEEVVLSFWRIRKPGPVWTTTATKYGSQVKFEDVPSQWKDSIVSDFRRTGLLMGGIDVLWPNDDYSKSPLWLEVSPLFSPNPPINSADLKVPYSQYKNGVLCLDGYHYAQAKTIYDIADKFVGYVLTNSI